MKKTLLAFMLATVAQLAVAQAPAIELSPFNTKVYDTGEPVANKPGAVRDFIEFRHARGFSDAQLPDLQGKKHALNGYKNKLVFVDIWATWCEPCLRSLPAIHNLQKKYNVEGSNIQIVSVALDRKVTDVQRFLKRMGREDFTSLVDVDQKLGDVVPLDVIPSVFILDGEGNLVGFIRGYIDWTDAEIPAYLERLAEKYADMS